MTLANKRMTLGLKASLMAPVLAVGILASAPASAASLGGAATLGDIQTDAASNIIKVGRRGRHDRGWRRHGGYDNAARHRRRARRRRRRNAVIGIGLGLLGAAILANRHKKSYHYDDTSYGSGGDGYRAAKRKCARVYGEDYVWRTDLVYDEYGDARVCKFVKRAGY